MESATHRVYEDRRLRQAARKGIARHLKVRERLRKSTEYLVELDENHDR
jgi:hypothetical protein